MLSLCYVSTSTRQVTKKQLLDLLKECRTNNKRLNITGLLLYNSNGTFMQVLQGEEQTVCELFDQITKDARHQRVHCISKKAIEEREFPEWNMGFRSLSDSSLHSLDGFSQFVDEEDDLVFLIDNTDFTHSIAKHFQLSGGPEDLPNS